MTVLVAYVPRPEGRAAVMRGIEMARLTGQPLYVVNAGPGGDHMSKAFSDTADMDEVDRELAASGVTYELKQFVRGRTAAEEIEDLAEQLPASMLVIGLRRRSPVGKLVLGSVAQDLLMGVECPVLAVKR
jgi:nucleotide-binding universal stress UspA family protein